MVKFVHLQESVFGKTFSTPITMPAFIRRIRDGRGRVFCPRGGAGQNLTISAGLDNLLKEGNLDLNKTV